MRKDLYQASLPFVHFLGEIRQQTRSGEKERQGYRAVSVTAAPVRHTGVRTLVLLTFHLLMAMALLWAMLLPFHEKEIFCTQNLLSSCHVLASAHEAPLAEVIYAADSIMEQQDEYIERRETRTYLKTRQDYQTSFKFMMALGLMANREIASEALLEKEQELRKSAQDMLYIIGTMEI